jgi:hypothetical protein
MCRLYTFEIKHNWAACERKALHECYACGRTWCPARKCGCGAQLEVRAFEQANPAVAELRAARARG